MSHEIEIPQEVTHVVVERGQIWSDLDAARNRAGQLNQMAEKIGGLSGTVEDVKQPLTQSKDPRVEIDKVLAEVNSQISEINKINHEIGEAQKQIEAIKARANTMIVLIVVGLVIAAIAIFALLSSSGAF